MVTHGQGTHAASAISVSKPSLLAPSSAPPWLGEGAVPVLGSSQLLHVPPPGTEPQLSVGFWAEMFCLHTEKNGQRLSGKLAGGGLLTVSIRSTNK